MLRDVVAFSGIVAKIHAMKAKMLTLEDYKRIASMETVTDIILYLKGKEAYKGLLGRLDDSLYHRGSVEKVLTWALYDDYTRLYCFSTREQKEFLKLFLKRYEVNLINHCLRIVFNHYKITFDLDYKKAFFNQYSHIRIDRLITSKNVDDLVENLRGTEYYAPLLRMKKSGADSLFDYDLALNLFYFSGMWKRRKQVFSGGDYEVFTKQLGTEIDLLNLQWIYRAKKYYRLEAPDIYNLVIPIHYKLRGGEFKALVEAPSVEEFFHILNKETYYGKRANFDEEYNVEDMVERWLSRLYVKSGQQRPYSYASISTYLFLKEKEINTIVTAMECVRYGLSERETLRYMKMAEGMA